MMSGLSIIPEWQSWFSERLAQEAAVSRAAQVWTDGKAERPRTSPAWTRDVNFTDAEWRFLWRRFQPVGVPLFGFARRLQCSTTDVLTLSAEQRCWVLALAFKYRRKVFFNPHADKLTEAAFVHGVRELATKEKAA